MFGVCSLIQDKRSDSPESGCVSMKSDNSMEPPLKFRDSSNDTRLEMDKRSDFPEPSCVSMKSDMSMEPPLKFRDSSPDMMWV
ncbi:NLR family CARD domain-containing protein 3 isoform X3 [Silurus asotus]|uniref:NLR family CARD domain-containing protein 3 isoform X3 n=1 Tax=Silurus asotus TaxID=30991 RepID=A0AAD5FA45_SILAS|nr:NLR family CARD domain-containing protein 3 isoform X3 [Silurus asotus]